MWDSLVNYPLEDEPLGTYGILSGRSGQEHGFHKTIRLSASYNCCSYTSKIAEGLELFQTTGIPVWDIPNSM